MSKVMTILSGFRDRISHRKHELGEAFGSQRNERELRGGSDQDVAQLIEEKEGEEWSSEEDGEDERLNANALKNLDNFLDNDDPLEIKARSGKPPLVQSQDERTEEDMLANWTALAGVGRDMVGKEIRFRARVHLVRSMSAKLAFVVFREHTLTIQGVLGAVSGGVSENMVRWAQHTKNGSIIVVKAKVKKPEQVVQSTSTHHVELEIEEMHLVSARTNPIPFSVYEAEAATDGHSISDRVRLGNRILDLRTPTSQAIFRVHTLDDPIYLCHPPKTLGVNGARAIVDFFQSEE